MRITVLCTDLGVRVPGDKGASMHLAAVTKAFVRLGHDVQLIGVAGHGDPPEGLADCRLLAHPGRREGIEREHSKLAFVRKVGRELLPAVRAFGPDVIYERLSLFGVAGLALAAAVPGCRLVLEVNALLAEEEARWRGLHHVGLATRRERRTLAGADLVVAVSDEVLASCRRLVPQLNGVVVPNGMEAERFAVLPERAVARRSLGLSVERPLACFVGALRPWHGVEVAIDALGRVRHDADLVVVGDGPVRSALDAAVRRAGLTERVHFLGQRAHGEVVAALAAADVALAPYPALDGFAFSPLKLYEYLAAGTPVVASRIGQVPEVLAEGRFGTLVAAGDAAALAAAIDDVLADPGPFRHRAALARRHAMVHHSWEERVSRICHQVASLGPTAAHRPSGRLALGVRHALAR